MKELYHTEDAPKRAFLIGIRDRERSPGEEESLAGEFAALAESLGVEIAAQERVIPREDRSKFGVGSGKARELTEQAASLGADCLIFDWEPSPSQQRNWEALGGIPVIDRTELIIRIFASRARTREAELQVELAELSYALPRLSHKYIDLSRQRGGSYGTRGAGETRFETDRRAIRERIRRVRGEIERVRKNREIQRKKREKTVTSCALVGYTNSGKSSLLNALTGAGVPTEDKLFATLDPVARLVPEQKKDPSGEKKAPPGPLVLIDTVGFIRRLPHNLVDAFRSTLEEAVLADLLIHVLDASDPGAEGFFTTTMGVLRDLGADKKPMILALNKADRGIPPEFSGAFLRHYPDAIPVSAKTGQGLPELLRRMEEFAAGELSQGTRFRFPPDRHDLAALLHRRGTVLSEKYEDDYIEIEARISPSLEETLRDYAVPGGC
ncbi:MAG: GTPase HflX [Spirochaetaceae bacterium]|jgi:GTP-binding protein HflX|nr:GTPase HflX [Spirochaetaceae bacterium]